MRTIKKPANIVVFKMTDLILSFTVSTKHIVMKRDYLYLESQILLLVYYFGYRVAPCFFDMKSVRVPAFFALEKTATKFHVKITFSPCKVKQIPYVKMNLVHTRKN